MNIYIRFTIIHEKHNRKCVTAGHSKHRTKRRTTLLEIFIRRSSGIWKPCDKKEKGEMSVGELKKNEPHEFQELIKYVPQWLCWRTWHP